MNIRSNSYLLVDTSILRRNISRVLSELPGGVSMIPVLKDDAYGLGLERMAGVLSEFAQVTCIACAHVSEGIRLRDSGYRGDILILGNPVPCFIPDAVSRSLTVTLAERSALRNVLSAAAAAGAGSVKVQVEIDSGLHRTGFAPGAELGEFLSELGAASSGDVRIELTGVYSHFSNPGDPAVCGAEYNAISAGLSQIRGSGYDIPSVHVLSSAGLENTPQYHFDAVRIGRRLYMDAPGVYGGEIAEIASWRTYITGIYERKKGDSLGYGGKYTFAGDAMTALIGVGYGDGLNEELVAVNAPVLVKGRRCPLLACFMYQAIIDISGIDCSVGDEVTLFGYDSGGTLLPSQEIALMIGDNEGCGLISALSPRVERVYI